MNNAVKQIETLEAKYNASTGRNAYKLGAKLRELKQSKAVQLANAFSTVLNEWMPDKMFEINLRNKEASYQGFCATHDFCDPNQAMIDAFKELFSKEPSPKNQLHCDLTNKAWNLAKDNDFKQL